MVKYMNKDAETGTHIASLENGVKVDWAQQHVKGRGRVTQK